MVQSKQSAYYRTRLCKFSDHCPYGIRCFYAHSEDQIRRRSGNAGALTCTKSDIASLGNKEFPLASIGRPRDQESCRSVTGRTPGCLKVIQPSIPTLSTNMGESSAKCSLSDDQSSDGESQTRIISYDDFDAATSERSYPEIRCYPGFVLGTHPHHMEMLRSWYCYERARGLLYSCRPDSLYKILKEAEPPFYSD